MDTPTEKTQNSASQGDGTPGGGCFLCALPVDLVIFKDKNFVWLAGLGPLVDGYSLLAVRQHIRSMADIPTELVSERDALVGRVHQTLSERYGRCLITEHGRMVVCNDGDVDPHCYHGHFLLFPGVHDISSAAESYFGRCSHFDSLSAAMAHAATCDEYVLISPNPEQFNVFSVPLNIPRQFTRVLVAASIGKLTQAHWMDYPERERALAIASDLKNRREW